jgi:hypothetical protein
MRHCLATVRDDFQSKPDARASQMHAARDGSGGASERFTVTEEWMANQKVQASAAVRDGQ